MKDFNPALNKIPMLSIEDEKQLIAQYKANPSQSLVDKIITGNWRYVARIAHRFGRQYRVSAYDLFQEGLAGMTHALTRFEPEQSYNFPKARFTSYAKLFIIRKMQIFIMKNISVVSQFFKQMNMKLFYKENENSNLIPFADTSTNLPLHENEGSESIQDSLVDENPDTSMRYELASKAHYLKNTISNMLNAFSDRDQLIIRERFMSDDGLTLQELGDKLQVTRERIRQIETQVLTKLTQLAKQKNLQEFCA